MRRLSLGLAALVMMIGCASKPEVKATGPVKEYSMEGEVLRLDGDQMAVIRHKDIEGWMKAMTMDYSIRDKAEYARMKAGDHIMATVFVQGDDYWVGRIRQYQSSAPADVTKAAAPKNVPNGR